MTVGNCFNVCVLAVQGQRTVYRLTLVKAWNTDEIRNYADLVARGRPDFIEVKVTELAFVCDGFLSRCSRKIRLAFVCCKYTIQFGPQGVTYCGDSKASDLTMKNVPWHDEVLQFVEQLTAELHDYEIASEHEHSNCVLVAHKKVRKSEKHKQKAPRSFRLCSSFAPATKNTNAVKFQFKVQGRWHTWIDYEKFHELVQRHQDSNGKEVFTG